MMRNDVNQFEFQALVAPSLTEVCAPNSILFGRTIYGVEDRHASKVSEPNRPTVVVEIVERGIDYNLEVTSKSFHIRQSSVNMPKFIPISDYFRRPAENILGWLLARRNKTV